MRTILAVLAAVIATGLDAQIREQEVCVEGALTRGFEALDWVRNGWVEANRVWSGMEETDSVRWVVTVSPRVGRLDEERVRSLDAWVNCIFGQGQGSEDGDFPDICWRLKGRGCKEGEVPALAVKIHDGSTFRELASIDRTGSVRIEGGGKPRLGWPQASPGGVPVVAPPRSPTGGAWDALKGAYDGRFFVGGALLSFGGKASPGG